MAIIFENLISVLVAFGIVGFCKSLEKSGYYLDVPKIERMNEEKPRVKIYVGKLVTFVLLFVAYGFIFYRFGGIFKLAMDYYICF